VSFQKEVVDEFNNPNQFVDSDGRLMVGAAVNTHDYETRVPALIEAGADVLFIVSSDGYSEYQADVICFIKENYPNMIVIGGNVVNVDAYNYLADAGADGVMVGIGGGSICITQEVVGIGRGQAKAVYEVGLAAKERGVPILSDGAASNETHFLKALGLGANGIVGGNVFVHYQESPAISVYENGMQKKLYYGEGTKKAQEWKNKLPKYAEKCSGCSCLVKKADRYDQELFREEGVERKVPFAGNLHHGVNKSMAHLKYIMNKVGCYSILELQENLVLEYVSEGSREEGRARD